MNFDQNWLKTVTVCWSAETEENARRMQFWRAGWQLAHAYWRQHPCLYWVGTFIYKISRNLQHENNIILYFCIFSPIFFTGYFKGDSMVQTMAKLRTIKVNSNDERITPMTELAFIPRKTNGQYPGLFIFTGASRCIYYTYFFQFK